MTAEDSSAQNQFYRLLAWLDSDPVQAGTCYENIRRGLIKILSARGCHLAEELTDEVIDRVTKNIDHLSGNYEGAPHHYFYAVARNVFYEYTRRPKEEEISEQLANFTDPLSFVAADENLELDCLRDCLDAIDSQDRKFVTDYYAGEHSTDNNRRRVLSLELGQSINHLRVRAHRIRLKLRRCYRGCRTRKKL